MDCTGVKIVTRINTKRPTDFIMDSTLACEHIRHITAATTATDNLRIRHLPLNQSQSVSHHILQNTRSHMQFAFRRSTGSNNHTLTFTKLATLETVSIAEPLQNRQHAQNP